MGCTNGKTHQSSEEKQQMNELVEKIVVIERQMEMTSKYFSFINPTISRFSRTSEEERFQFLSEHLQENLNSSQSTNDSFCAHQLQILDYFEAMQELQQKLQYLLTKSAQFCPTNYKYVSQYQSRLLKKIEKLYSFAFNTQIPSIHCLKDQQKKEQNQQNVCLEEIIKDLSESEVIN